MRCGSCINTQKLKRVCRGGMGGCTVLAMHGVRRICGVGEARSDGLVDVNHGV